MVIATTIAITIITKSVTTITTTITITATITSVITTITSVITTITPIQASQVWMLREAASALRALNTNLSHAMAMERRATAILRDLLPLLNTNATDGGWWWMLHPASLTNKTGVRVEARFIHDFLYVGQVGAMMGGVSAICRCSWCKVGR